jgi:hypothetical protein
VEGVKRLGKKNEKRELNIGYKLLSLYTERKEKKLFLTFSALFFTRTLVLLMVTPSAVDKLP